MQLEHTRLRNEIVLTHASVRFVKQIYKRPKSNTHNTWSLVNTTFYMKAKLTQKEK